MNIAKYFSAPLKVSLHSIIVFSFAVFLYFNLTTSAQAAVRTWDGGGSTNNWSEDANWSSDLEPGTGDIATFSATSTKAATIDGNISVGGIDINTGYSGTITQASGSTVTVGANNYDQAAGTFTGGNSTIDINGSFTLSSGAFTSTTGTLSISEGFTNTLGGTFTHNSGTVVADGSLARTWNVGGGVGTSEEFHHFTLNSTAGGAALGITSGDTLNVNGTLTLTDGAFSTGTIAAKGSTVTIGENFGTTTNVTGTLTINGSGVQTVTIQPQVTDVEIVDQFTVNNASATINGAAPIGANTIIGFDKITLQAGTMALTTYSIAAQQAMSITGGTMSFTSGGTATFVSTFEISSGAFNGGSSTIRHNGTLTISGGTYTASSGTTTTAAAFTHTLGGDFTHNSGTFVVDGAVARTWNVGTGIETSEEFYHFTLDSTASGAALVITSGDTLNVNGTLTLTDGAFSTGTIAAKGSTVTIGEDFGTTTNLTGTLVINGSGVQTVTIQPQVTGVEIVDQFTVNNASATINGAAPIGANTIIGFDKITLQAGTMAFTTYSIAAQQAVSIAGGTMSFTSGGTATFVSTFEISSGAFNGGSSTINHNGAITISGGTYTASSGTTTMSAAFTRTAGGTFTHNSGSVTVDGASATWDVPTEADVSTETFYNLTIAKTSLATLTITSGDTLVVNNTLLLTDGEISTGTVNAKGSTITIASTWDGGTLGNVLLVDGSGVQTVTHTVGAAEPANMTRINNADAIIVGSGSGDLNFYQIDLQSGTFTAGGAITVTVNNTYAQSGGTFNAGSGAVFANTFSLSGGTFNAGSGVTFANTFSLSGGTFNGQASTNDFDGAFTLSGGTFNATTGTMNVTGAWTHTDGGTFNHNNGSVVVDGAGVTWDFAVSETFYNFQLNKNNAATLTLSASDTLIVENTATMTEGRVTTSTSTMDVRGDVTVASTYDTGGTTKWLFSGSSTQNFTVNGDLLDADITVNKSGGSVQLQSTLTMNASGQDLVLQEGTFDLNGNTLTVTGAGTETLIVETGANLQLQGGETITTDSASYPQLDSGSTVTYDGTSGPYTIKDYTYHHLTFNGSGATFSLGANETVGGDLTVTAGTFDVNDLTLSINGNTLINGGTLKSGTNTVTFGNAGSDTVTISSGTFEIESDAPSTDIVKTAGTWTNSGGTITYNAATTITVNILAGLEPYYNLTINSSGSTYSLTEATDVDATVTLTAGTLSTSGSNYGMTVGGGWTDTGAGTFTEGSGTVTFDGAGTVNSNETFNNIIINASGTVAVGASLDVGGTLAVSSGTFNANANTVSVLGTATISGGTYSASTATQTFGGLTVSGGTFTGSTGTIDVNGNVLLSSGTLTAPAAAGGFTIQGNFTKSGGTFTHNSGTVTFDANANHSITGSVTWNSLTLQDSSDNATDVVLTVEASSTQTINGTLTLDGLDSSDRLNIVSSSSPTAATFDFQGSSTFSGDNLDIMDNTLSDNSSGFSTPLNPANSVNSGNTTNWFSIAGFTVSAISGNTTEAGGTATFTVVLTTEPSSDVSLGISSNDTTEGTVSPSSLTFTAVNWATPQTVTVTGVNDDVDDGDIAYSIVTAAATSADSSYNTLNASDVSATNTDNDTAGVTVTESTGTAVTEGGTTDSYTVVLTSQPTNDVTVSFTVGSQLSLSSASFTFTSINWASAQTLTVTAVNDSVAEGSHTGAISHSVSSSDGNYSGFSVSDVTATITDNDTAGITVGSISGTVAETGTTATFTVVLTSQPLVSVVIGLTSNDTTEGTVSPASLTFTTVNWATPQTVTVTGVNDFVMDGTVAYSIVTAAASAVGDSNYNGLNPTDVSVSTTDNDTAGFSVSAISGTTSETGTTATYTISLTSQPTNDVTIGISSSDTSEGTVSPSSVVFTSSDWNSPQTVTVTGVDDLLGDGTIAFSIVNAAATSSDPNYNGLNPTDVSVSNTDNETPGITLTQSSGSTAVTEGSTTDSYTLVLTTEPSSNVTVTFTAGSQLSLSTSSLLFTTVNWATPQTLTVTAVNDSIDEDTLLASITHAVISADGGYNGLSLDDVSVTVTDDDTAGITVGSISGTVAETGTTATYTLVLTSQPTNDVSLAISSSDTSLGTVSPASVTFTALNWSSTQLVTVTGVNNDTIDGTVSFTIVNAAATSSDTTYNGLNPADVSVSRTDNDTAGVTLTESTSTAITEGSTTDSYTLVLTAEPSSDVTITFTGDAQLSLSTSSLIFTALNWDTPQTLTLTAVDDSTVESATTVSITHSVTSADSNFNGFSLNPVTVTMSDNDTVAPSSGGGGGGGNGASGAAFHANDDEEDEEIVTIEEVQGELDANTPNHWASGYIKNAIDESFLIEVAIKEGSFMDLLSDFFLSPDLSTNRSSALRFLLVQNEVDLSAITVNANRLSFTDVEPERSDFGSIEFASQAGLINGYSDGTFKPDQNVNRAEAIKLVFSFYKKTVPLNLKGQALLDYFELEKNPFNDVDLDSWYAPYLLTAYHYGVVKGYPDGSFKPGQEVSHAEFLKIAILSEDVTSAIELASELE